jgi:hypothetical protein
MNGGAKKHWNSPVNKATSASVGNRYEWRIPPNGYASTPTALFFLALLAVF